MAPSAGASTPTAASASLDTARSSDVTGALRAAAQSGNVPRLKALLAHHIDIDARDPWGRTALMLAVRGDRKEAVEVLLAAGADPNATDAGGTTPLEAAAGAQPEIAAALRRAGAR
jgi:ankyrin repeat protein